MSPLAAAWLTGVLLFTNVAILVRGKYPQTFTADLLATILILIWPVSLVLALIFALTSNREA